MSEFTTHLNLEKPSGADFYTVTTGNSNFDKIDEAVKSTSEQISSVATDVQNLNTEINNNRTEVEEQITNTVTAISNLNEKVNNNNASVLEQIGETTTNVSNLQQTVIQNNNEVTAQLGAIAINVKDFGAKGDGVTDDTNAINQAINHVSSLGGGKVLIPEGTYMIKGWDDRYKSGSQIHDANFDYIGGIILKSKVSIEGAGRGVTVLKEITTDSYSYNIIRIKDVHHVTVSNLTIEGDLETHTGALGEYGHGIAIFNSQNVCILQDKSAENCNEKYRVLPPDIFTIFSTVR